MVARRLLAGRGRTDRQTLPRCVLALPLLVAKVPSDVSHVGVALAHRRARGEHKRVALAVVRAGVRGAGAVVEGVEHGHHRHLEAVAEGGSYERLLRVV